MATYLVISKDKTKGDHKFRLGGSNDYTSGNSNTNDVVLYRQLIPKVAPYRMSFDRWIQRYHKYIQHIHAYVLLHLTNNDAYFAMSFKKGEKYMFDSLAKFIYDHSSCAYTSYKFFK